MFYEDNLQKPDGTQKLMGLDSITLRQMSIVKVSISLLNPYCMDCLHSQRREQAFAGHNKFSHKIDIIRGQIVMPFKLLFLSPKYKGQVCQIHRRHPKSAFGGHECKSSIDFLH